MKVTCTPLGGLGNQLWVVASTIGLAHRHGYELALPPTWEYRSRFSVPPEFFAADGTVSAHSLSGLPASKRDYLQVRSLWANITDDIHRWFQPSALAQLTIDSAPDPDRVAVHIRRTDYHTLGSDLYVQLWDTDYYDRAVGDWSKADVFTDDPLWCDDHLPHHVRIRPKRADWLDLFNMAGYRHHVIANSTFSWWAAFLSDDPAPVYPSRWFGPRIADQGWEPEDFIPPHWQRVDV